MEELWVSGKSNVPSGKPHPVLEDEHLRLQTEKDLNPQKTGIERRESSEIRSCVGAWWVHDSFPFLTFFDLLDDPPVLSDRFSEGKIEYNTGGAFQGSEAIATGSDEFAPATKRCKIERRQGTRWGAKVDCDSAACLRGKGLSPEFWNTNALLLC